VKETKSQLSHDFDMKDLGELQYGLRIEMKRYHQNSELYFNEIKYVENILSISLGWISVNQLAVHFKWVCVCRLT